MCTKEGAQIEVSMNGYRITGSKARQQTYRTVSNVCIKATLEHTLDRRWPSFLNYRSGMLVHNLMNQLVSLPDECIGSLTRKYLPYYNGKGVHVCFHVVLFSGQTFWGHVPVKRERRVSCQYPRVSRSRLTLRLGKKSHLPWRARPRHVICINVWISTVRHDPCQPKVKDFYCITVQEIESGQHVTKLEKP